MTTEKQPTYEAYRAFVDAVIEKSDRGMCPVCSYLWSECECGVTRNQDDTAVTDWWCICAGQGGMVYSSGCPIHDGAVNTSDPNWRRMYTDHLEAQQRIKERLGW